MIWLLLFLILSGVALLAGSAMLGLAGRRRPPTLADLEALFDDGRNRYAHLGRIVGRQDFEFVMQRRGGPELAASFRRRRARLLRLYLSQMQAEFDSLMAVGSLLASAPTAQAERFARQLAHQRFRFTVLLAGVFLRARVNAFVSWPLDVEPLDSEIRSLRYHADRILHALSPADLGALRNVLRS
jgi:hypothetical protein